MEELLFKKGQLANLPEDRQNGTFYVAEDAKTIYLNDMILQDTENVKKELTDIIVDNELVTANALTYLYDNKADVDALNALESKIPIRTSQLSNDSGFVTASDIPNIDLNGYSPIGHTHDDRYYTESEMNTKLEAKQNTISDLETIRTNAAKGATALQAIPEGYATEEYVNNKISDLVNGAPDTLDTLDEIAAALKDNADIVTVLEDAISNKLDKDALSGYTTIEAYEELKAEITENEYVAAQSLTLLNSTKADKTDIPTSTSQLVNDSGFITASEIPSIDESKFALKDDLNAKQDTLISGTNIKTVNGFSLLGSGDIVIEGGISDEDLQVIENKIPTATSQLTNDSGFITASEVPSVDESKFALKSEIPDVSNFITSIPSEYVTDSELADKGYLTTSELDATLESKGYITEEVYEELKAEVAENEYVAAQALTQFNLAKADKTAIPTSTSQLTNDSGFITASEIPSIDESKFALKSEIPDVSNFITSIPSEYVTDSELTDKGYLTTSELDATLETKGYATEEYVESGLTTLHDEITNIIIENELVIANALTKLDDTKADKNEIPNSTSQLINDSGFITASEVPSMDLANYVTDSELADKGYATSGYVDTKIAELVNGAPETLNTLDELAAALKDNKDIVDVLNNSIATKQDTISDLATIRTNAEKGATALQYIPDEYITDAELTAKGYATESYVDTKVGGLFTLATETDINNLFN